MESEMKEKKKENNVKFIAAAVIAVVTLIVVASGAAYAYYSVGITNTWTSARNVNASTTAIGTVSITNTANDLSMQLSRTQEMTNTTYYAQAGAGKAATTTATNVSIGTVQSTGGNFNCNIGFNANYSNNSLPAALVGTGELMLLVNGTSYDLKSKNTNFTFSVTNFPVTTTAKPINVQLKYVIGTATDQTSEGGKSLGLNLSLSSFTCTPTT